MPEPLFRRLSLLGFGLIGSSLARVARERGDIAAEAGGARQRPGGAASGGRTRHRRSHRDRPRARGSRCRRRDAVRAGRRLSPRSPRPSRRHWRPAHSQRRRLHQAVGDSRRRPAGARRACISCRRTRWPAPSSPAPTPASPPCSRAAGALLTPLPGTDPDAVEKDRRAVAPLRLDGRDDGARAARPGAGDRQPSAAPDRLHHLRHGGRSRRRDAARQVLAVRRLRLS